jgi:ketosteroid isomerase-like protein
MQSRAADGDAERIRALDVGWAAAAARRDLDGMMAIYAHEPRSQVLPVNELSDGDATAPRGT